MPSRGQLDNVSLLHNGDLEKEIATSCMSKQFLDPFVVLAARDSFVAKRKLV